MLNENEQLFLCTDLALASALVSEFPIIKIDVTNPKKAVFVFKNSPKLQKMIAGYWNNTLAVEPKSYFQSIKLLKNRIYQG